MIVVGSKFKAILMLCTLREEHSQIIVILQLKLLATKLSVGCTVYKQ